MRQNLMEAYSDQLAIGAKYVKKTFGTDISDRTKLNTAVLLDNTNKFMNESMNTVATNRGDLGDWKKFC